MRQRNHNFKHSITQQLLQVKLQVKLQVPLRMFQATQFLAPPFHPTHGHFSSSYLLAPPLTPTSSSCRRFAELKTDEEEHRERTLKKNLEDAQYCSWLWETWREQQHYCSTNRLNCTNVKQRASAMTHSVHSGSQKAGQQCVSTGKFAPHYCWFDETP